MALVPILWLAFVAAVVFGMVFSIAIVLALSRPRRSPRTGSAGGHGGVQMLFRFGLGAGALGIGAVAHAVGTFHVLITLDGNQVGMSWGGADLPGSAGLIRRDASGSVDGRGTAREPGHQSGLTAPPW